jgi:hypothetical protein
MQETLAGTWYKLKTTHVHLSSCTGHSCNAITNSANLYKSTTWQINIYVLQIYFALWKKIPDIEYQLVYQFSCTKCTAANLLTGECRNDSPEMKHDLIVSSSRDRTIQINSLGFKYKDQHEFPVSITEEDCKAVIAIRYEVSEFHGRDGILRHDTVQSSKSIETFWRNIQALRFSWQSLGM